MCIRDRYWLAETYGERIAAGQEPDNYDKEYMRLWFKERFDPYADTPAPEVPAEVIEELERRYRFVYESLAGTSFAQPSTADIEKRIDMNLRKILKEPA